MNRFTVLTKPCWFRYDHFCVSLYRYASINTACLILLWPFHHCTILSSLISENSSSVRLLTAYSHSAWERKKVVLGIAFVAKVSSEEMLFSRTLRCSKWISGPVASLRLQIRRPIYPYVIHAFFFATPQYARYCSRAILNYCSSLLCYRCCRKEIQGRRCGCWPRRSVR